MTQLCLKKGELLELVWQEPQSPKQLNSWFFESYHMTIAEFKKRGKTSSHRSNSGRTSKVTGRNRSALKCIVRKYHRTTTTKVTTELNQHLNSPVSIKPFLRELNKIEFYGRAAVRKPLLSTINIQKRLKWCRDHKCWSTDQWKQVIFPDFRRSRSSNGPGIIPWWYLLRRQCSDTYRSCGYELLWRAWKSSITHGVATTIYRSHIIQHLWCILER